jgi:hypothetical protein
MIRGLPLLLAAVLGATHPSPAQKDVALANQGLTRAAKSGALAPDAAAEYRTALARVRPLLKTLPPLRAEELGNVLHDVASLWRAYNNPQRALVLFTTLSENEDYLTSHRLPEVGTDVIAPDGVVYRYFPGHGFVFHPLAEFAQLNNLVSSGQEDAAAQLAAALLARGIQTGGTLRWEYEFPFSVGKPPWTSGMAQAVAAQALARAGDRLSDPALLDAADAAARAVPQLLLDLPAGPWIRLYAWSSTAVLNAQLQTVLSLGDYATISGDPDAQALADRLQATAAKLLPRFDTGFWSLYSLSGDESPLGYHDYVIQLLKRLAVRTGDQSWRDMADRFQQYETEPPELHPAAGQKTIYPDPQDGYKDAAPLRFWLSKLSTVTLRVGKTVQTFTLGHGPHVIWWDPGEVAAGVYHPRLTAVDQTGKRVETAFDPVLVRSETGPPAMTVVVTDGAAVHWEADDPATPWLDLAVRLSNGSERRVVDLGRRRLTGTAHLKLPPGRWHATLLASNSAGHTRSVSLGYLPRPA